jgi:hypothetical protein
VPAVFASDAKEAVRGNATAKVRLELVGHEGGQLAAARFQIRHERRPVFPERSVQQGCFGTMALVGDRGRVAVACCWLCGKHQQAFSATRRVRLLAQRRGCQGGALKGRNWRQPWCFPSTPWSCGPEPCDADLHPQGRCQRLRCSEEARDKNILIPLFHGMTEEEQAHVIASLHALPM